MGPTRLRAEGPPEQMPAGVTGNVDTTVVTIALEIELALSDLDDQRVQIETPDGQ